MNQTDSEINSESYLKLYIKHQETYSRSQLLLRTFFGVVYILIPHVFILLFLAIGSALVSFVAFWVILFTRKYPLEMFNYQVKLNRWLLRLQARLLNLSDGYPSFGLNSEEDSTTYEVLYPEIFSRGTLILRLFFGFLYCQLPHLFVWYFRNIATQFLVVIAWFIVLFTGKYPKGMHEFNVGTIRWMARVNLYMANMTDNYPPFRGKP